MTDACRAGVVSMPPRPNDDLGATPTRRKNMAMSASSHHRKSRYLDANANETAPAGNDDEDYDAETRQLSQLRCASVCTEEIAIREREKQEREERRRQRRQGQALAVAGPGGLRSSGGTTGGTRCADYPGLQFGSAMFGSDTLMKFSIIKNELHNIMKSQLRRVEGEVGAMSQRIRALDDNLAKSEAYIKTATTALAEAVQMELETRKDCDEEENALSQFDAQMKLLEGKLEQAEILAAQARELDAVVARSVTSTTSSRAVESGDVI